MNLIKLKLLPVLLTLIIFSCITSSLLSQCAWENTNLRSIDPPNPGCPMGFFALAIYPLGPNYPPYEVLYRNGEVYLVNVFNYGGNPFMWYQDQVPPGNYVFYLSNTPGIVGPDNNCFSASFVIPGSVEANPVTGSIIDIELPPSRCGFGNLTVQATLPTPNCLGPVTTAQIQTDNQTIIGNNIGNNQYFFDLIPNSGSISVKFYNNNAEVGNSSLGQFLGPCGPLGGGHDSNSATNGCNNGSITGSLPPPGSCGPASMIIKKLPTMEVVPGVDIVGETFSVNVGPGDYEITYSSDPNSEYSCQSPPISVTVDEETENLTINSSAIVVTAQGNCSNQQLEVTVSSDYSCFAYYNIIVINSSNEEIMFNSGTLSQSQSPLTVPNLPMGNYTVEIIGAFENGFTIENSLGPITIESIVPAEEVCNGLDDDCDGLIDEGLLLTFYRDYDNDGFGNLAVTAQACSAPDGYVSDNTDCEDNDSNINTSVTEICNGVDDDCDGLIDEGVLLTFYRDQDNDGFGKLTVTIQACEVPIGYVSNSSDCNDNNALIKPGAIEVCNGVDDDCDGQIDEGCNAILPPANDIWANAVNIVSTGNVYPNCSIINGTIVGATDSPESIQQNVITGEDVWYKFTALSSAARIRLYNLVFDGSLEIYTQSGTLVESENLSGIGGQEIMNITSLNQGNQYYLAVRNYNSYSGTGTFSLCIQHLLPSYCASGNGSFELCSNLKPAWTGANQYVFTFVSTENFEITSGSSSSQIPLSMPSLSLHYGSTYTVTVSAVYYLTNGIGAQEIIQIESLGFSTIFINPHADVKVKDTQVCPSNLIRNSLLQYKPFVCGAIDFDIRFTQIDAIGNPIGIPFVVNRGAPASTLHLSFLAPQPLVAGGRYLVEVRPIFQYGAGSYGSPRCILISSAGIETFNFSYVKQNKKIIEDDIPVALIYPNPNLGETLFIDMLGVIDVNVFDYLGRKLDSFVLSKSDDDLAILHFTKKLSQGIYMIEIYSETNRKSLRLVVE